MAADIAKLWQLEEIAAAGHHELAANLRTAINELTIYRARPVSCSACNAAAKRIEVLERECMASRVVVETEQDRAGFVIAWLMAQGGNWSDRQAMLHTARLATDENGGLGA